VIRRLAPVWATLAVTVALVVTAAAPAEPAPISLGVTYTQNFDSLASTGTSSVLPSGWALSETGTNANTTYTAGTGSGNAGDTYSFGALDSAERAFGTLLSGSLIPTIGAEFINNTGSAISSLSIAYTGEQWRLGTLDRGPDRLFFQISTNATSLTTGTWADVHSLDFVSPSTTGVVGLRDGNAAENRAAIAGLAAASVEPGATFWIRLLDFNAPGADDGLAVDDFSITAGTEDLAPSVTGTTPSGGAAGVARDANVTVTFSEPVNVGAGWYTISCANSGSHTAAATGGPQSFTLDPDTDFAFSESCTVTVVAAQVSDQDALDPPDTMGGDHVFSFTTAAPPLQISDVQGAGHVSPFVDQIVSGVEGVVTVKRPSSFWIQDATPDSNPSTSEGILVFGSVAAAQVVVGDLVRVSGRVTEFRGSPVRPNDLTLTELTSPTVIVDSHDNVVPAPVLIGIGGVMPPTEVIDDDTTGSVETGTTTFDPANDGLDFWESYEGMLLQANNGAVVNETESFGEITLLPDNGFWATGLRTPRGGILARDDYGDFNPERFTVDDEILRDQISPRPSRAMPLMNVGDRIIGSVVGPLDYSFSNFKIQALTTPTFFSSNLQPETAETPIDQELAVATFNVENLSVSPSNAANEAKFDTLARMIVENLRAPDLIGIEEVQDDSGPTNNGVVDATQTWSKLVAEIQAAGGPLYEFRSINPLNNEDGGAPGGNIRVGFLFRTDRGLSFVDRPGGDATTATSVVPTPSGPVLSVSPGRVDPENDAWFETRKPVVGEFRARGKKLFVVVNHFSSKGDDQPLMGHNQPPNRLSEVPNALGLGGRHAQAQVVNDFVNEILDVDPTADVIVLGDINDFEFSETVDILEGDGELFSAIKTLPANERYSYVFEGNSQVLDQILLSRNLYEHFPYTYDVVHVNSEFADQASDHEPAVVRIDLTGRPAPKP
jgi:predicted extracellular nuclease